MSHRVLLGIWSASIVLSLLFALIVAQGMLRDTRAGEPVVDVDISRPSDWTATPFRVWRAGQYKLFISAVNFDSTHLGAVFEGDLEVTVTGPSGVAILERRYPSGSTGLVLPYNYGDAELMRVDLRREILRPSMLRVRVARGDPRFSTAQVAVKLWRERADAGMGGLVNYVMILPALFFGLLSFAVAVSLAKARRWKPLVASVVLIILYFSLRP